MIFQGVLREADFSIGQVQGDFYPGLWMDGAVSWTSGTPWTWTF